MAPPSKKNQLSLFDESKFSLSNKEFKEESAKFAGFSLAIPKKSAPKRKSRADGIYLPEEKKPLTYGLRFEDKRQRIPEWALPTISTFREDVLRIINENDVIGLDFEYNPTTRRLSIIGVATNEECAACKYDPELGGALIKKIDNPHSRFIGHFVLGADKPVLEEATGIETPLWLWEDSMISHYLCAAQLAKAPGKESDSDGALGMMSLGFAAHLWTTLIQWKECLLPDTKVILEDGSTKTIKDLVETRSTENVLSYDTETGNYVSRPITNWYTKPLADNAVYVVDFTYNQQGKTARVTWNHPLLVKNEEDKELWLEAWKVTTKYKINTGWYGFSRAGKALLAGMLLGDSHVNKEGNIYIHGCSEEYQRLKEKVFRGIGGNSWKEAKKKPEHRTCYNFKSKRTPPTREVANIGAFEFAKQHFDATSLAIWYLDDGYLSKDRQAEICCNWLSVEEAEEMCEIIGTRCGIECYIPPRCYKNNKPRILFTVTETEKLSELICVLVPPDMDYKLLTEHRGKFNNDYYKNLVEPFYSTAWVFKDGSKQRKNTKVYCIDVEGTHNFATHGGIVHNCRGLYCEGPCPSHSVFEYCAVDSWAGLQVFNANMDFMSTKGIPMRVYTEHKELALNFCLAAEKRGMIVDLDYARKLEEEMEKKKENLFPKGNSRFNPRSNIQVVKWFEKNGLKLTANDKGTVELALEARIHETLGLTSIGEIDDESEAMMDEVTRALYDLYIFKSMGKGTDAWVAEKYITYETN